MDQMSLLYISASMFDIFLIAFLEEVKSLQFHCQSRWSLLDVIVLHGDDQGRISDIMHFADVD